MTQPSDVTVRSTPQAVTAIADLTTIINGPLLTHFDELRAAAKVLIDPESWDGRSAVDFRTTVWPGYDRTLTELHTQLDQLRARLAEIQNEIQSAG
ncbi:hypothetical protein ThrDRAFT_02028 [Frankia casuarinae]|jgi:uncharacterized protein YukE|uniref:Pyrophosphorylase n=1 Tax=Frankia casuarinae (strain DSM 45818 / CECT 9043 / HFP020203 / CcI3) TaxID=106370 RepID=Q2JFZ5_FRACC|nr:MULTISPECIES: hypothetical protein [Frankia]ABD09797.1 hypothetical protein Francci3_0410 [Frankia casuarinae]ETA04498.1 hypothetical protein CcI6DRAFT_00274 [Frankia sp. CcI6]EYT92248.1 hypothetical protein ThrDRAFT_02028 [Frankia casuarinae]KDA40953.1 hypothetical protein BMG523Draft_04233 [Frankia sp. BMG5.23]OAA29954.1 hypothetical protein AAY23_101213 [Frankia casuarinae]